MDDWSLDYDEPKTTQKITLTLVSAPTVSLVTTAEAKNYLKMSSDTTDDTLVDQLVTSAQTALEIELGGVSLVAQTWRQQQQGGVNTIQLMREPVVGTPTVSYYEDFATVTATTLTASSVRALNDTLYHVDGYFKEGRQGDGYTIEYDAGLFTGASDTDPRLDVFKTAILRTVAWLYDQREEHVKSNKEGNWSVDYDASLPAGIKRLVMPFTRKKGIL